jgi:hypothetical protein
MLSRTIAAPSVKAAADALRAMQRNWSAYPATLHRRMALIEAQLPPVKSRERTFRIHFLPGAVSAMPGGEQTKGH